MTDVTDNLEQFSEALRALVPHFEKGGIGWRDSDQYDEFWDIADALFSGFVTSIFVDNSSYVSMIADYKYDMTVVDSKNISFVVVDVHDMGELGRFEKFVSINSPFDSLQYDAEGQKQIIKFDPNKIRVLAKLP